MFSLYTYPTPVIGRVLPICRSHSPGPPNASRDDAGIELSEGLTFVIGRNELRVLRS